MKTILLLTLVFVSTSFLPARNPIAPLGLHPADPSAKVGADGRLYVYCSLAHSAQARCHGQHDQRSPRPGVASPDRHDSGQGAPDAPWTEIICDVADTSGIHAVVFQFQGKDASGPLLDWWQFE